MSSRAMAARLSPWHSLPSRHEGEHPSRTTLALPRPFSAARIATTASFPVLASSERRGAISCEKGRPLACLMSAGVDLVSHTAEAGTVRSRSHVSNASHTWSRSASSVPLFPMGNGLPSPVPLMMLTGKGRGTVSAPVSRVSARRLPATTTLIEGSASPCPPLCAPPLVSRLGLAVLGGGLGCSAWRVSLLLPALDPPMRRSHSSPAPSSSVGSSSGTGCERSSPSSSSTSSSSSPSCSPAAPPLHSGAFVLRHSMAVHV